MYLPYVRNWIKSEVLANKNVFNQRALKTKSKI